MSQKIKHQNKNIHTFFDKFDLLYSDFSDKNPIQSNLNRLWTNYLPYCFKQLTNIFNKYGGIYSHYMFLSNKPKKLKLPEYNSKNIIVCFSGGKDSIATVLHYQKLGYNVYLYHLKNINKAYPNEYENAQAVADALGLMLYVEQISLSGNHKYTEHPMKNMIIANCALQWGIRNNIGIKVAFGNYYTALLKDNEFDICAGDCRDMWTIYENIIRNIIPKFRMYIPLKNVKTTLNSLKQHKNLLSLSCSCLAPYRYREYWKNQNEEKYDIKLPNNRCGTCWKCALEYIYYTDHNVWKYNKEFYKHCLDILLRNSIKENTKIYSIYQLWNNYLFYPINKSKLKGIQNAIIQTRKIKFTKDIK